MKQLLSIAFLLALIIACQPKKFDDQDLLNFAEKHSDPDRIKQHVAILAADSMRGRLPGSVEYDMAMDYVINQYKSLGIQPIGDDQGKSYFQQITFRKSIIDEPSSFMILNNQDSLKVGEDYFFMGNANVSEAEFSGEVVLAGYGIEAPDFGWNDFENLNVEGKIVVVFSGGPDVLPVTERAHFSNSNTKIETLIQKKAEGILFAIPSGGRGNFKGSYNRISKSGIVNVMMPSGEYEGRSDLGSMKFGGYVDWSMIQKLTENKADEMMTTYENGGGFSIETDQILSGKATSSFSEFKSPNVVGVLEGGELKNEYIIHTAHLDHVGVGQPVNGDSIYNGAHDNASGISAMLEIARLYSELPSKPKRSVIFAAVTAEEMGLLGSLYLAKNPVVPRENIIVNVNTDMPMMVGPLVSIEPLGSEQSNLGEIVAHTASLLDVKVDPDHLPEEVRFVRSDNYSFVKEGIPALRMKFGMQSKDSKTGLDSAITHMMTNLYHKPSDELGDSFDFDGAKSYVKLQFMNSYFINNSESRPAWKDDSFFKVFEKN